MTAIPSLKQTATELRNDFDRSFTLPPTSAGIEQSENLLLIRIAGDPYAIRVKEIRGLENNYPIALLPSDTPELIGVAGIRGELVSAYSLAALLGYPSEPNDGRWLALCGNENRVGLVFSTLEGYLRVPAAQVFPARNEDALRGHVKEAAIAGDIVRALVNIPVLEDAIRTRGGENRLSSVKSG